ncbi:DUF4097 family beta strand repeat-containing protein [Pseudonocardia yunnanensis]
MQITASDRTDTLVEVRPSDKSDESDVKAAQQVRVDYTNGTLQVTGPKRVFDFSRKTRSVDVSIELPTGSQVSAEIQAGDFHSAGRLGECRFKTGAGNAQLERTGPLRLNTGAGHLTVDGVAGNAELSTGTGKVRLGNIEGTAVVKSSNGDIVIDAVAADVRVRTANGEISIDRAGAGVEAKTANGGIRIGEVVRGTVALGTAAGDVEIGIAEGTAAWLDVNTGFGHVRNQLETAGRPGESDETVEVRARTSYGDVTIRRS